MIYLAITHLVATVSMAGLIWFVQIVHYPLFNRVGESVFVGYENQHTQLTARVVGLPMLVEGVSALALFFRRSDWLGASLPLLGLFLLLVVHCSTVFLQVPRHRELSKSYSAKSVDRLVRTNWIRTIGWSARSVVAILIVLEITE